MFVVVVVYMEKWEKATEDGWFFVEKALITKGDKKFKTKEGLVIHSV